MLTVQEYEKYKKRLQDAEKTKAVLIERRNQLLEKLKSEYNLSLDEAKVELERLNKVIPQKEAEFSEKMKVFEEKWSALMTK